MSPAAVTFQTRLAAFKVALSLGLSPCDRELQELWRELSPEERRIVGQGHSWAMDEDPLKGLTAWAAIPYCCG